jgi:ABC-2 type transport system ATP-binding protein
MIGLVPQEIARSADLTAEENLRFFGRLHGMGGRELDAPHRPGAAGSTAIPW